MLESVFMTVVPSSSLGVYFSQLQTTDTSAGSSPRTGSSGDFSALLPGISSTEYADSVLVTGDANAPQTGVWALDHTAAQQRAAGVVSLYDELTRADKKLVLDTTGWNISEDPLGLTASADATALAGRMSLDASDAATGGIPGMSSDGEVSAAYFQNIIDQQAAQAAKGGAPTSAPVPFDVLHKAMSLAGGVDSSGGPATR